MRRFLLAVLVIASAVRAQTVVVGGGSGGGVTPLLSGTSITLAFTTAAPNAWAKCSGTPCAVSVGSPAQAGDSFCAWAAVGVSAVITLTNASGVYFTLPDMSAYQTTAGGTAISTAGVGNRICFVAADTLHWDVLSTNDPSKWTMD